MKRLFNRLGVFILALSLKCGASLMAFQVDANGTCQIEGAEYPAVGFGTYPLRGEVCLKAMDQAAGLGYRLIDTATFYGNFEPIGEALKKYGRAHFYLISKVWPNAQTAELLRADLFSTLDKLQTSYLDAYLLHWPNSQIPIEETLGAMEELRRQGLIRHIGLSNVNVNHVKRALETGIPIAWVQIEMHPLFYDTELLAFCHAHQITVQAWAPLGRGRICQDPILIEIGEKYGKTASQIAIKWILQHGCIPLPGSRHPQHMQQNLEMNFILSQQDMREMDERAGKGKRERITKEMGLGFSDEFDFSYDECWPVHP